VVFSVRVPGILSFALHSCLAIGSHCEKCTESIAFSIESVSKKHSVRKLKIVIDAMSAHVHSFGFANSMFAFLL